MKRYLLAAGALALAGQGVAATKKEAVKPPPKEASLYVQCDGLPNNMSDGETAVRVLALAAVVGLLAPSPEAADPAKRKFGADGVAACTGILTGEKAETNVDRRLGLIMARAIHRIEAKDYEGAIADIAVARGEAKTAALHFDPYFRRTRGLSFDQIEAAALLRLKRFADADARSFAAVEDIRYSFPAMLELADYSALVREASPANLAYYDAMARLYPGYAKLRIARLAELGSYKDAAAIAEDWTRYDESFKSGKEYQPSAWARAQAALMQALAGDWARAEALTAEARQLDAKRVADGVPEANRGATAEYLDMVEVLKLARDGNAGAARRMFTGRSAWLEVPFGAVMSANARVRPGAKPDELFGTLAKSADEMWAERRDAKLAEFIAKDGDNKTLFALMKPNVRGGAFESLSGKVWKTDKSKILIKKKDEKDNEQIAFLYLTPNATRYDAFMLHSALMAKKDGKPGLLFIPFKNDYGSVAIRLGTPGDAMLPASFATDAGAAITALSPIIPEPLALKARKAAAAAKK